MGTVLYKIVTFFLLEETSKFYFLLVVTFAGNGSNYMCTLFAYIILYIYIYT